MSSIADASVIIQSSSQEVPRPPSWFGEVVLIVTHLRTQGILAQICERIRFARPRFGQYEVIDFLAVLFGYAISGERTLETFYEALKPFARPFMALFGRDQMPSRSALSRFLAALTQPAVEALRALFLEDGPARPLCPDEQEAGLLDRLGQRWTVFDVDGTREAARQRALPQTDDLPPPHRRLDEVCAPGYTGRKRGEVVRTRTTVSQAHSFYWLGSFGNRGNGRYREEQRQATGAIDSYLGAKHLPRERTLLRLDGQYGTGAVLTDLAGFSFVTRGKDYAVLKQPEIQMRLHLPADQSFSRPESALVRQLTLRLPGRGRRTSWGTLSRGGGDPSEKCGKASYWPCPQRRRLRTLLDQCTARCLYCRRRCRPLPASPAFEPVLADEDQEIDPNRWCSHSAWGQEAWSIMAQWVWNLRLELGHHLKPELVRTTEFAPALNVPQAGQVSAQGYEPPVIGGIWKAGCYSGEDFALQADGTVCCPEGKKLFLQERRQERDGSLRMVYETRLADCRVCEKRPQCQWHSHQAQHPRRVSVLLHPRKASSAPLLWRDWPRRQQRRACIQVVRHQQVHVEEVIIPQVQPRAPAARLTHSQRAHYRLSWRERLARNVRAETAAPLTLKLFGVPDGFARFLGLAVV